MTHLSRSTPGMPPPTTSRSRTRCCARTVCNQKIVLFRRTDGTVAALEDACWHRLLPLSKGRLHDDEVTCGYHGLVFNGDGRCTHMPSQETINPSACVRSLPGRAEAPLRLGLARRPGAGRRRRKMPDLHWNDDPEWAGDGKLITVEVRLPAGARQPDGPDARDLRARLQSIGQRAVAEAPFVATHGDRTATVTRWMERHRRAAVLGRPDQAARGYEGKVDRWQIIRFEAPCTIAIDVGVAETGTGAVPDGQGDRCQGRQRLRAEHHHARDRHDLPLLLGLRAQLLPRRAAPDARAARGRGAASSARTN